MNLQTRVNKICIQICCFACLVVVLAGAAEGAALALDALPRVLLHADDHVLRELQACGVACNRIKQH